MAEPVYEDETILVEDLPGRSEEMVLVTIKATAPQPFTPQELTRLLAQISLAVMKRYR
jgi:hypothetical protein